MKARPGTTYIIADLTSAQSGNHGHGSPYVVARKLGVAVVLAIWGCAYMTARPVYAYLDPGAGSFLFQLLIGAGVSVLFLLKVYWKKITGLFTKKRTDVDDDEDA